jgi:hypothetical protein
MTIGRDVGRLRDLGRVTNRPPRHVIDRPKEASSLTSPPRGQKWPNSRRVQFGNIWLFLEVPLHPSAINEIHPKIWKFIWERMNEIRVRFMKIFIGSAIDVREMISSG